MFIGEDMREKIEIFKVLSEPNRVRILMMLLQKPMCVCEITSVLNISTATVSNHLSFLRKSGFIEDEKEGKWINYKIAEDIQDPIIQNVIGSLPDWFADENEIRKDHEKVKNADRHKIICNNK
jgi:ArsR family transcriptional regulator, arsenate/arsenite/antimonite-responsive transcriptional repressor